MNKKRIVFLCILSVLALMFCIAGYALNTSDTETGPVTTAGYTLGMDGNLSLNYFLNVKEGTDTASYVEFTVNGITQTVTLSEATVTEEGYFKVTCELPAAEMNDTIKTVVKKPDGNVLAELADYSAVAYAAEILNAKNGYSIASKDAVRAMLNYATMAQVYFDHNTESLANTMLSKAEKTVNIDASEINGIYNITDTSSEVEYVSSTLGLESETVLYHYFTIPADAKINDFTVECEEGLETECAIIAGRLRVKLSGIPAHELSRSFTVNVTYKDGSITLEYSPLKYVSLAIETKGTYSGLVNLVKTLYVYNQAAYNYVNSEYADLQFELLANDTYDLVGMNGQATVIIVPETYNGKAVTSIHTGAFKNKTDLERVIITDNVTNIGNSVFSGCTALTKVTLGKNVQVIGTKAFNNTSIKEVVLPDTLVAVGQGAFENTKLEKITLPFVGGSRDSSDTYVGVTKGYLGYIFGASAYLGNETFVPETLKTVVISSACTEIRANAFDSCIHLENVVIGNGVTYIANYAFRNCSSLTSVTIPESVTSIPADAYAYNSPFYGCSADLEITIMKASKPEGYGQYWNAVSADKFANVEYKTNDYELPEITPGAGSSSDTTGSTTTGVTILPVKDGLNGIVTIVHDDGQLATAQYLEKEFTENGLVGTLAIIAKNVIGVDDKLTANAAEWQRLVNTGLFDVANHTQTHTWYGFTDKSESGTYYKKDGTAVKYQYAPGHMTNEIVGAAERLRSVFPGQRVLTYIIPGFSCAAGYEGRDEVALEIIRNNFISQRSTSGTGYFDGVAVPRLNKIGDINFESLNCLMVLSSDDPATWLTYIDNILKYNGWGIYCFHNITPTASSGHYVLQSDTSVLFEYIGEKVKNEGLWCATMTDASLYTKEYQYATAKINASENTLEVSITDGLDDEIFNMALTVKIVIPEAWSSFTLNGKAVDASEILTDENGNRYIMTDIVPDVETAVLEKVN